MELKCSNGHLFTPTVTHPVCPTCDQPGVPFTEAKETVAPIMQNMGPSPTPAPAWGGKKKKK